MQKHVYARSPARTGTQKWSHLTHIQFDKHINKHTNIQTEHAQTIRIYTHVEVSTERQQSHGHSHKGTHTYTHKHTHTYTQTH